MWDIIFKNQSQSGSYQNNVFPIPIAIKDSKYAVLIANVSWQYYFLPLREFIE